MHRRREKERESNVFMTMILMMIIVSLRMQSDVENQKSQFTSFSNERYVRFYLLPPLT